MSRVTAAELAARVPRCNEVRALEWLEDWERRGIVDEVEPGRFRLTKKGHRLARGLLEVVGDEEMAA